MESPPLIPLFVVTGVLLLASGLVKLRTVTRMDTGTHLPSLVEIGAGLGLPVVAVVVDPSPLTGFVTLGAAFLLLVASCLHLGRRLRLRSEHRGRTEGRRLQTYLRYIPDQDNGVS